MKKIQLNYNKIKLQKTNCEVAIYNNKHIFYAPNNLIGFWSEYYNTFNKAFINNFCNYCHRAYDYNKKLYYKYPDFMLKSDYEVWCKKYSEYLV
jgi:hypothetical protein